MPNIYTYDRYIYECHVKIGLRNDFFAEKLRISRITIKTFKNMPKFFSVLHLILILPFFVIFIKNP